MKNETCVYIFVALVKSSWWCPGGQGGKEKLYVKALLVLCISLFLSIKLKINYISFVRIVTGCSISEKSS